VAVASAGPYASLHLAPDRQPDQHPTTLFYRPDAFLPPNQQHQSTEGRMFKKIKRQNCKKDTMLHHQAMQQAISGLNFFLANLWSEEKY